MGGMEYGGWGMGYGLMLCGLPLFMPLASSPLTSNLSPAAGSVLTQMPKADAGAVRSSAGQNRHHRPKGDIFGEWIEER